MNALLLLLNRFFPLLSSRNHLSSPTPSVAVKRNFLVPSLSFEPHDTKVILTLSFASRHFAQKRLLKVVEGFYGLYQAKTDKSAQNTVYEYAYLLYS